MQKVKEIQSFNWLVAGSQRTGKTVGSLTIMAELQIMAYRHGKVKRVLIYNPDNQNPILEKRSLISEAIRHTIPNWKMPDWWYNQRVFHSWQIPTIEQIFKIDLQKKTSQN